jgi:hypothetical protein
VTVSKEKLKRKLEEEKQRATKRQDLQKKSTRK